MHTRTRPVDCDREGWAQGRGIGSPRASSRSHGACAAAVLVPSGMGCACLLARSLRAACLAASVGVYVCRFGGMGSLSVVAWRRWGRSSATRDERLVGRHTIDRPTPNHTTDHPLDRSIGPPPPTPRHPHMPLCIHSTPRHSAFGEHTPTQAEGRDPGGAASRSPRGRRSRSALVSGTPSNRSKSAGSPSRARQPPLGYTAPRLTPPCPPKMSSATGLSPTPAAALDRPAPAPIPAFCPGFRVCGLA